MQKQLPFEKQPERRAPGPELEVEVEDFDADTDTETPPPVNCANVMAWHMLRGGLGKAGRPLPLGLYILLVPTDEWREPIKQVVRDVYLDAPRLGVKRRMLGSDRPLIQVLDIPSAVDTRQTNDLLSKTQDILALGVSAILIANNLASVPNVLQRASDRIISVPRPNRQFLSALVRQIVPTARRLQFQGLAYDRLTPSTLRLAYRPGVTAGMFSGRLRNLTASAVSNGNSKFVPLDRLHGVDEAKQWAVDLKADLTRYRMGQIPWHDVSRGLILSGPPGTAKTTLAGSMANFCDLAFISTSYAEWQRSGSGHLGDLLKAMAAKFTEARSLMPALLFIDELDSIGARGQGSQRDDWWRSVNNGLLPELDGTTDNEGVIFVGATNHPDLIDPAILRSGRLEEHIKLYPPGVAALTQIYRDQLQNEIDDTVDLQRIGQMSAGMTGADVVKICAKGRRRARNAGRPIRYEDLLVALTGREGPDCPDRQLRIALHEAGHAIAALASPAMELSSVTIVGWGDEGGGTSMRPQVDGVMTPNALDAYLTAILAGRAAEEILVGEISGGSGGREGCDLSRATGLAADAELSLGMRGQGLVWYAPRSSEQLAELFAQRPDLEWAVRDRLDQAYARARALIQSRATLVLELAKQLLTRKVMTGAEVEALAKNLGREDSPPAPRLGPGGGWLH